MHQMLEATASSLPEPSRLDVDVDASIADLQELRRRLAAPARSELGLRRVFERRLEAQRRLAASAD